jgi:hypothetical protein
VAIPSTGTDFVAGGFNNNDSRFLERGKLTAVLVRDARGPATDISPYDSTGAVKWSPLATNGQLRNDLFAIVKVNGVWQVNGSPNEGWHLFGAFKEGEGPSIKPSIDKDDFMIEQQDEPFDSIRTKQDEPFTVTAVETLRDSWRRLRNDLPFSDSLGNLLVKTPGASTGWSKALGSEAVDRQVLLVRQFTKGGKKVTTVKGYSLCHINEFGEAKMGKKDAESAPITFQPLPDGIFISTIDGVNGVPIIKHEWISWGGVFTNTTQYTVGVGAASAGTFTLTYGGLTTATIAYNAAASAVKSALVALDDGFDASKWTVTGSAPTWTVTVPDSGRALTGDGTGLTGGTFAVTAV